MFRGIKNDRNNIIIKLTIELVKRFTKHLTKAHLRFPEDKEELLSLVDQGNAQPFHVKTCTHCHAPTKYNDWQSLRIRANQLSTAYSIDYYSSYEPFYIAKTRHDRVVNREIKQFIIQNLVRLF